MLSVLCKKWTSPKLVRSVCYCDGWCTDETSRYLKSQLINQNVHRHPEYAIRNILQAESKYFLKQLMEKSMTAMHKKRRPTGQQQKNRTYLRAYEGCYSNYPMVRPPPPVVKPKQTIMSVMIKNLAKRRLKELQSRKDLALELKRQRAQRRNGQQYCGSSPCTNHDPRHTFNSDDYARSFPVTAKIEDILDKTYDDEHSLSCHRPPYTLIN